MQVYDEKCMTKYPAKCVKEQSCTMVYRTMCDMQGYGQNCRQMPSQTCVPVTKCHRIPKTQCKPIKEKECGDVEMQIPVRQMIYKCQPFEPRQDENLDECMGMMAGNDMIAPPIGSSYGPPGGVTPDYGGTNGVLLPLTQPQTSSSYAAPGAVVPNINSGSNAPAIMQPSLLPLNQNNQQAFNVDAGLSHQVQNSYTVSEQVPPSQTYTSPTQSFNNNLGQSQGLPNSYTSSQNFNAPTQNIAQTLTSNNNNNNNFNNAPLSTYTGGQQTLQPPSQNQDPSYIPKFNSGSSFGQSQNDLIDTGNNQQLANYNGGSKFNQQSAINSYTTSTIWDMGDTKSGTLLLTPQEPQLQQPFINSNNNPQTFSAPSTYTSPALSNYAIQTPFAPTIDGDSNNEGDITMHGVYCLLINLISNCP